MRIPLTLLVDYSSSVYFGILSVWVPREAEEAAGFGKSPPDAICSTESRFRRAERQRYPAKRRSVDQSLMPCTVAAVYDRRRCRKAVELSALIERRYSSVVLISVRRLSFAAALALLAEFAGYLKRWPVDVEQPVLYNSPLVL